MTIAERDGYDQNALGNKRRRRSSLVRLLQFDMRFLLFLMTLVGIGILWSRDRQQIEVRIANLESRFKPFAGTSWSTEQATGPPDTPSAGDRPTAWASATPDGQAEWLELTFDQTVRPHAVEIYETYNPGAVFKITAFDRLGIERTIWEGVDPTSISKSSGISKLPLAASPATNRIRIYVDSIRVPGWNEIDAVGLRYGLFNQVIWADKAAASSTFGGYSGIGGLRLVQ